VIHPQARRASPGEPGLESGAAGGSRAWLRRAIRSRRTAEYLVAGLLGLLVLVVHDVAYLLRVPFWTDEAWVAVTTRFSLSHLPATTSSTPIGWSVLLRLVTVGGEQTGRLLPLAFAGAAVVIAYWLGRGAGWRRPGAAVAAGALAAAGVLLMPAMLVRDDLKQYTADACAALLTLAMTSRLERNWSRRGLVALSATVAGGMLFSDAAAFAGVAAFVAVSVVALARRSWPRLAEAVVAGAGTAVLLLGIYEAFYARAVVPGLTAYWRGFYLPAGRGLHADVTFVTSRFGAVGRYLGLGPAWLAVPLVVAGLITLFRLGRPAVAVTAVLLWPEMLALSAARKYPFLDLRTSTFLFAVTVAVAAIGVVGVSSLLFPARSPLWPRLRGILAAGLPVLAVAAFAVGAQPYLRSHLIPREDVRDQARYVAGHAAPGDVILVNLSSNWGFAYYWPRGQPARRADSVVLQGYEAYFPGQPDIVVARNRDAGAVDAALAQALARARQGSCGRIWLIRTHVSPAEGAAWRAALRRQRLSATAVGRDGLSVIRVGPSQCR
jgi:hypothetical protein